MSPPDGGVGEPGAGTGQHQHRRRAADRAGQVRGEPPGPADRRGQYGLGLPAGLLRAQPQQDLDGEARRQHAEDVHHRGEEHVHQVGGARRRELAQQLGGALVAGHRVVHRARRASRSPGRTRRCRSPSRASRPGCSRQASPSGLSSDRAACAGPGRSGSSPAPRSRRSTSAKATPTQTTSSATGSASTHQRSSAVRAHLRAPAERGQPRQPGAVHLDAVRGPFAERVTDAADHEGDPDGRGGEGVRGAGALEQLRGDRGDPGERHAGRRRTRRRRPASRPPPGRSPAGWRSPARRAAGSRRASRSARRSAAACRPTTPEPISSARPVSSFCRVCRTIANVLISADHDQHGGEVAEVHQGAEVGADRSAAHQQHGGAAAGRLQRGDPAGLGRELVGDGCGAGDRISGRRGEDPDRQLDRGRGARPAGPAVRCPRRRSSGHLGNRRRRRCRSGAGTAPPASAAGWSARARSKRGQVAQHAGQLRRCPRRSWPACRRPRRSCTPGSPSSPVIGSAASTATAVRVRWRSSASVPDSTVRPVADDADPVAERLDLGEDVAGQQHGRARAAHLARRSAGTPPPSAGPAPRWARPG